MVELMAMMPALRLMGRRLHYCCLVVLRRQRRLPTVYDEMTLRLVHWRRPCS